MQGTIVTALYIITFLQTSVDDAYIVTVMHKEVMQGFRHIVRNQTKVVIVGTVINLGDFPTWNIVIDTVYYSQVKCLWQCHQQIMVIAVHNTRNIQVKVTHE